MRNNLWAQHVTWWFIKQAAGAGGADELQGGGREKLPQKREEKKDTKRNPSLAISISCNSLREFFFFFFFPKQFLRNTFMWSCCPPFHPFFSVATHSADGTWHRGWILPAEWEHWQTVADDSTVRSQLSGTVYLKRFQVNPLTASRPSHTEHEAYKCLFSFLFFFKRLFLSGPIKSKTNCPGPHVLAGRGTVVCRRKSLELIRKEVCCLFRAETASRQDSAERLKPCNTEKKERRKEKIKERGGGEKGPMRKKRNKDVSAPQWGRRTRNNQKLADAEIKCHAETKESKKSL